MSNEVKIGIFATIVIAFFVWGYKFLEGKNLLSPEKLVYARYQNIEQLAISSPVFMNGFQVGTVTDIRIDENDIREIIVQMSIRKEVKVPKSSTAVIISPSLIAGKAISLEWEGGCDGPTCAGSGDFIKGRNQGFLEAYIGTDDLTEYTSQLSTELGKGIDTLNARINDEDPNNKLGQTMRDLQQSMANLQAATDQFNRLITSSSSELKGTLSNLNSITGNVSDNNQQITELLENAAAFSASLKKLDLDRSVANANTAMERMSSVADTLSQTLSTTDQTMQGMNEMISNINNGEGTLGKLMSDDTLYFSLARTSQAVELFLQDFQDHPYRYVPLKSRRKVKKYDKKDAKEEEENVVN